MRSTRPSLSGSAAVCPRSKSHIEDEHGLCGSLLAGKDELLEHAGQGFGFGNVAFEDIMGQNQPAGVEDHADARLAAVVAARWRQNGVKHPGIGPAR